jgi:hypothetical protein
MNARVEAPDGSNECRVETSDARTAKWRGGVAIAPLVGGIDE